MQVIKDKQVVANDWVYVVEAGEFNQTANFSVPVELWLQHKAALLAHTGKIGVRINPNDDIAQIADDLQKLAIIELDFPIFTDGRLFSQAQLLRGKYGFTGEIRAVGNFMPDQMYYLSRVGVNAFALEDAQVALGLACLEDFSVNYQ